MDKYEAFMAAAKEFTEKAQKLSSKLGFSSQLNSPMTLTAIYNQDEKDFQQKRRYNPIGFN